MRKASSRAIERAAALVALECEREAARIRRLLSTVARGGCADCGARIEARRRAAMPSTRRCLCCQQRHELKERRGW